MMATEDGDARSYEGKIKDFNPKTFSTYKTEGQNYKLRKNNSL